jgi:hypothetical protein
MVYTVVYEMLIDITPLATRHGERNLGPIRTLLSFSRCEAHGAHTRLTMKAQLLSRPRLTIAEPCELFRVAEQHFDLETCFVIPVDRVG